MKLEQFKSEAIVANYHRVILRPRVVSRFRHHVSHHQALYLASDHVHLAFVAYRLLSESELYFKVTFCFG